MVRLASQFIPSGFFVLRTPLLPLDELLTWSERTRDSNAVVRQSHPEETGDEERRRLRLHLEELLQRPEIQEALFVASPSLVNGIDRWRRDANSKRGRRVETSLVRYFLRMAGRPTPFGLFAGYSLGRIDSKTQLVIESRSTYRRHTRLDMEYLCALVAELERDAKLRQSFIHRPNSSLYRVAGRVRYVESQSDGRARNCRLVAIEPDSLLDAALSLAKDGIYPPRLAAALAEREADLSFSDAEQFVNELIESQILVSDLNPSVTGDEPVAALISKLTSHRERAEVTARLKRCAAALAELDEKGLGNAPADYEPIMNGLAEVNPNVARGRQLQIDLMKPAPRASLGRDLITEIARGVEILRQSFAARQRDLSFFRSVFLERYGAGREVPLLEALDPDAGIAFALSGTAPPGGFVGMAAFPFEGRAEPRSVSWSRRDTHLLNLIQRSLVDGYSHITLDPHDLEALRAKTPASLPDAFAVRGSVAAPSESDLARGRFRVSIRDVQGPSGARLLGRFCHSDSELLHRTREHIRAEEALRTDALFAEIVHLPAGRTGNILLRPRLRDYEIPYLGGSGSPVSRQISVADLCITVIDRRVVLRSMSLRREVIPRLTAAHYYASGGLDVYRFLCLLQDQGHASELEWDWGPWANFPFLPRVCFQRLVLSRARWRLNPDELRGLRNASRSESAGAIQRWRAERKWPRWIAVVEDDRELPIDLDNVLCTEALAETVKWGESAQLVEVFPTPDELCVRGPEGRFAHEIIVPFVRARPGAEVDSGTRVASAQSVKRTFAPGSEWLYLKLYTGKSTADQLLREFVRPFVDGVLRAGDADRWFFLRYGDPFWHIRLRFHGSPERLHGSLLPSFNAAVDAFVSAGKVWRVQIDTYEREIERYGGAQGICLAEKIFHPDSEAALTIVEGSPGNEGLVARRLIALRSIDRLLGDFALDLPLKRRMMESLQEEFGGPLPSNRGLGGGSGTVYRNAAEGVLDGTREMRAAFAREFAALERRSQQTASEAAELKACAEAGQLSVPLPKLISSLVHVHTNRLLRPTQRGEELLLYRLLARYYSSRAARGRT